MARRFAIICLTSALFAFGLWSLVESNKRPAHIGQFNVAGPCLQSQGLQCKVRT
jgi:hypothetical protein